jgi:FkbM family methyltransferase
MLQANLKRNSLGQVEAFPVAAGAAAGRLTLAGFNESEGNFGLSHVVAHESSQANLFDIPARPLDEILAETGVNVVDLLKMDIEGAEWMAIEGLHESLIHHRVGRILLELHPEQLAKHGRSAADLIEQLRRFGYVGWKIDHSPRSNRRAAYRKQISLREILRPLEPETNLDSWPHLLWELPARKAVW